MYEKVNQFHPDKVADRIAGAIVDMAYERSEGGLELSNPRIAVEVLLGHGRVYVTVETSLGRPEMTLTDIDNIVKRIVGKNIYTDLQIVPQDMFLSENQRNGLRCGDNGIFCGCPVTHEQDLLAEFCAELTESYPFDGKYILDGERLIICQSNADEKDLRQFVSDFELSTQKEFKEVIINPLGYWTGGADVDCGCTNRKLGSDMGDAVTGGGLHGKDLSKADVSVNIVCHQMAQNLHQRVTACTAIGDEKVFFRFEDGDIEEMPFSKVVERARQYIINQFGSFEKFACTGLI